MLTKLLERKRHVTKAVETARVKVRDLQSEQAQAKGRLWELRQEHDRLTRTIFDQKAKVFLEEDRQPIEAEIERLHTRQPVLAAEILELQEQLIPRLERHLEEAQAAVKAEALNLRYEAALRSNQGREALLRQWNAALPDILRVAAAIGQFNGRLEVHQRAYRDAATEQRQPMHPTGDAIPATILHALSTALSEAWRQGYAKGEAEANAEQVNL